MRTGSDASVELRLLLGLKKPPFPVEREGPEVGMAVGGEEHHLRSPQDKASFDGHLHCIAFEETQQVAEWQVTVEVVEERRIVMVEPIIPKSSGTDGLHPQSQTSSRAAIADVAAFAGAGVAVDDVDGAGGIFRRDIPGHCGNAPEELDAGGMSDEEDWELSCELTE